MNWLSAPFAAFQRWEAMRALRAMQKRDQSDYRLDFKNMIDDALEALERGYRPRAVEIWTRAYTTFPDVALLFEPAVDLLVRLRMYDEAEGLMKRASKRYPNAAHPLEGLALVEYRRGDQASAIRVCEVLRKKHPHSVPGYWIAAASFSELGQPDEAEVTLSEGLNARPDDTGLRIEYARLADRRHDWNEAVKRWTDVFDTYGHSFGVVGAANAFTKLGRYEEADQLLSSVLYKWGNDISVWIGLVNIAEQKQNWAEAVLRWETVRKRFPLERVGYLHALPSILKSDQPERADEVLREGLDRLPYEEELWVEYAWLAHRRADWSEAAQRWASVRERFFERAEGYERGAEALMRAGYETEALEIAALMRAQT